MKAENHSCYELKKFLGNSRFTIYVIDKEYDIWYLTIIELAREETVKMGEASYLNEELSKYQFAIKYCPFCGQQL